MTTVEINLPDPLAAEAEKAGLLSADKIEALLREELREQRLAPLLRARKVLTDNPLSPMTAAEVQAEIDAYRRGLSSSYRATPIY